ncbi:MAG: DNA primase [Holosporaceae bacterium]|jgi:DNA primase|nr:DNA primase [Holosporaceae bacterium]
MQSKQTRKDFVNYLKERISIFEIVSRKVKLKKSGRDWFGLCPFHSEKTPSFKINRESEYYYCFGCGSRGDIFNFVMETEKLSFSESVEFIANTYGISIPKTYYASAGLAESNDEIICSALNTAKNWFAEQLSAGAESTARQYLESRGISLKFVEKFSLGFGGDNDALIAFLKSRKFSTDVIMKTGIFVESGSSGLINRFAGRLIFPILNRGGKCVGFGGRYLGKSATNVAKYINSPESEVFIKNKNLYGYSMAKSSSNKNMILVEGYLDVISMHQAGFDVTVAPLGTSISETQINMCWQVCDCPILLLDGDEAGIKASYRWLDKILPLLQPGKSFKIAKLPQGSDPDSLIHDGQSDVIAKSIADAQPLLEWLWDGGFLLNPSESPEQKAAVIKKIMDKIENIKDFSIKKLYTNAVKQKGNELYYAARKRNTCLGKERVPSVVPMRNTMEKILIVTIINHPYIIDEVIENFAQINFATADLRTQQGKIMECYGKYLANGDRKTYFEHMLILQNNIADFSRNIEIHAKFIGKNSPEEEVINGWHELFRKYSTDLVMIEDLQNATARLKSTFSDNDWLRLKALRKEFFSTTNGIETKREK